LSSLPNVRAALTEYMGTPYRGYDRPIFLGQGLLDKDVPAPSALSLYAQMKANNQPVELHVYPDKDHSGTVLASLKDSTPFVARIMR
ncbi:MAG: prolyl oligopeptidase family serine peptidase, partial [Gordonia sp.]